MAANIKRMSVAFIMATDMAVSASEQHTYVLYRWDMSGCLVMHS